MLYYIIAGTLREIGGINTLQSHIQICAEKAAIAISDMAAEGNAGG